MCSAAGVISRLASWIKVRFQPLLQLIIAPFCLPWRRDCLVYHQVVTALDANAWSMLK